VIALQRIKAKGEAENRDRDSWRGTSRFENSGTFKRDEKSRLLWIWDAELAANPQFAAFFVAPKANYNK